MQSEVDFKSDTVLANQENNLVATYLMRRRGADKVAGQVLEAPWERKGDGTAWQGL